MIKDDQIEVAPGLYFIGEKGKFRLSLHLHGQEATSWDYEQICLDPRAWFESLKCVANTIQFGPTVAKKRFENKKAELDVPIGVMYCNICSKKFVLGPNHSFYFKADLKGKKYLDFQCSEDCTKKRRECVYGQVLGEDFLTKWNKDVCGT